LIDRLPLTNEIFEISHTAIWDLTGRNFETGQFNSSIKEFSLSFDKIISKA
jgi:hypothetical protein